jgi:hypothetical protein
LSSKRRIYLQENPDVRFELDEKTGEVVMFVCGNEQTRKKLPLFSEYFVRKHFRQEIDQYKDFICPTGLEQTEGEAKASSQ